MLLFQLLTYSSIYSDSAAGGKIVPKPGQYEDLTYQSIKDSIKQSFADLKSQGRRIVDQSIQQYKDFPKVKTALYIGALAASSLVWATSRDIIHDKMLVVYSLKCDNGVAVGESCVLKSFVNGIDTYFGLKRVAVYLVHAEKKVLILRTQLKKFLSYAVRSETYPYIGFGEIEIPFLMPNVPKGKYQIQVVVHWFPSERIFPAQDTSHEFKIAEKGNYKAK